MIDPEDTQAPRGESLEVRLRRSMCADGRMSETSECGGVAMRARLTAQEGELLLPGV